MINEDTGAEYLVLAKLGRGTYGQVLKCQDLGSREMVAVKVANHYIQDVQLPCHPFQFAFHQEKDLLEKVRLTPTTVVGL